MHERGITRAAVIAAETDWAERATLAFRAQFEASGGTIVGEARLRDNDVNFKTPIVQATASLGDGPDIGVFITMRPQQARLLLPQLKIARVAAPVFATSHVYSGDANPGLDRDLDGVEFCDAPWLFGPVPGRPDRATIARQLASANGVGGRLFAFGMDSYALLPYLDWLIARNYRCRYGEIDLVMRERETLVFVEVRYRRSSLFGGGIDSVHAGKRAKLVRAAEVFLINHPRHAGAACRFDVVALTGDDAASAPDWRRNAFEA
jgi:uncharacterized protein (TIGR00252 family)